MHRQLSEVVARSHRWQSTERPATRLLIGFSLLLAVVAATTEAFSARPTCDPDEVRTAERTQVRMSQASNQFGLDLYQQIISKEGPNQNVFFSPYSVSTALMMAASGAVDETADEMRRVMRLPNDHFDVNAAMAALSNNLMSTRECDLNIANAIWADTSFDIRPPFAAILNRHFGTGGPFSVDFRHQSESVRQEINSWVEDRTNRRIRDLLSKGSVSPATRMVLVNAIYFRGDWSVQFDRSLTKPRPFLLADGTKIDVPTMSIRSHGEARYAAFHSDGSFFETPRMIPMSRRSPNGEPEEVQFYPADGFSMAELPYEGNTLSMVLIAPSQIDSLNRIESMLTEENLTSWVSRLVKRPTNIDLPKLKLETGYTLAQGGLSASGMLPSMGIKRVFTAGQSQLDAMTSEEIHFDTVVHKAFLEVDEKGTEAAAATAFVGVGPTSVQSKRPFTPTFKADRPFLMIIRDRKSGCVLFMGRIQNPMQ
ncbi:MAG: serpin family protein [Planctomycetaceae bacterium]|nr:serpin family protein [Planctomycetaceae bacterium]